MTAFLLTDSTYRALDAAYRVAAFAEGDDTEPGFDSHAAYFRAATAEARRLRDAYGADLLARLDADAATYAAADFAADPAYGDWCDAAEADYLAWVHSPAGMAAEDAREFTAHRQAA